MKKKLRRIGDTANQVKEAAKKPVEVKRKEVDPNLLIPSPCTTFNLECSGRIEGAFQLGKVANLIGDSHAGKTLFALSMFAECSNDPRFKNHRFIYDDVEAANEFDIEYLFGRTCRERVDESIRSRTVEDFGDNVARSVSSDPCIYVLDSFDALTSEAAIDKDEENRKKREKGTQTTGSYGDGKAKAMSDFFSLRTQELKDTESALIVVSQTRQNIGFGAMFTPKTRSGGLALKFHSTHEVWLAVNKKEREGKRTKITNVQAKITKNKLTGMHGECIFPILFDYGVDDVSACIKFLIDEGPWTGTKTSINTQGFVDNNVSYKKLIQEIEQGNREQELRELCQIAYNEIIEKLRPKGRKKKYS